MARGPSSWIFLVRLLVAAVFIYAGIVKIAAPVRFATEIANYHTVPWPVAVGLAFYLPWLELVCGLALLLAPFARGARSILLALTLLFMFVSIAAKLRGLQVSCGCFGAASYNLSFAGHLMLDVLLLTGITLLLARDRETAI